MALTAEQIKNRSTYIGGSDAKKIISGDWTTLYEDKVLGIRENLDDKFNVQLGNVTEEFNVDWFTKTNGYELVEYAGDHRRHSEHNFLGCLPDAIVLKNGNQVVIDAKHTGPRWADRWDEAKLEETYYPQAQHNMLVCGIYRCSLSVIFGNQAPVEIPIEYDPTWVSEYIDMAKSFWWHVESKTHPDNDDWEEEKKTIKSEPILKLRKVAMDQGNRKVEWEEAALAYFENKDSHKIFETAKKDLKKLVPDDAAEASGNGIIITRSPKNGSLRIKEGK